jgi:hypothetical protein
MGAVGKPESRDQVEAFCLASRLVLRLIRSGIMTSPQR